MAALEATVKDVQAEALRVMPQFVAFVQQGPTGWVSKAQVRRRSGWGYAMGRALLRTLRPS